jgi:glycerol-3-phosphate dehydrogenase
VNRYFRDKVTSDELVWSFAGVRALYDDGAGKPEDVTRDYVLALDVRAHQGPLLTVYGGKITTHRKLAETAMGKIAHFFPALPPWTAGSKLPGGEFAPDDFAAVVKEMTECWPFVTEAHARRLVRAYGTRAQRFLGEAKAIEDLGERFTGDLTGAEVRYLVEHEWAETTEDVLYRRSKFGLMATAEERERLEHFVAQLTAKPAPQHAR